MPGGKVTVMNAGAAEVVADMVSEGNYERLVLPPKKMRLNSPG